MALLIDSITALRGLRAEFTPGGTENEAARAAMLARRFTVTAVPETRSSRRPPCATSRSALVSLARLGDGDGGRGRADGVKSVPSACPARRSTCPPANCWKGWTPPASRRGWARRSPSWTRNWPGVQGRLNNPGFVQKAAPEAVAKARQDADDLTQRRAKLEARRGLL